MLTAKRAVEDEGGVEELLLPPEAPSPAALDRVGRHEVALAGATMGTDWSLIALGPPEVGEERVRQVLEQAFARVIKQMSQWEPHSELSRFNHAPSGTGFRLSRDFAYVLDCALEMARATDGAFDPTIGQASEAWGFGAAPAPQSLPDEEDLRRARLLDWRDLQFQEDGCAIIQPGGLHLDLSGIAKGFAVDLAMHELRTLGITDALLEIGGELSGIGLRADGLPWWVDLEQPPGSNAPTCRIGLTGWAVATSGNYRRRHEAEGTSWPHTIVPASGLPVDDILSASVLHRQCMQADALATALIVLGPDRGLAFADRHGIPARIVLADETIISAAWRVWLQ